MPSLPTRNQQDDSPQNAFRWYLSSLEARPSNVYKSILIFITATFIVSLSILSLKIYQLNWKSSHHDEYEHHKLYFLSEFYRTLCWSFYGHQVLSSVYTPTLSNSKKGSSIYHIHWIHYVQLFNNMYHCTQVSFR